MDKLLDAHTELATDDATRSAERAGDNETVAMLKMQRALRAQFALCRLAEAKVPSS